jgi:hypothetical protein
VLCHPRPVLNWQFAVIWEKSPIEVDFKPFV